MLRANHSKIKCSAKMNENTLEDVVLPLPVLSTTPQRENITSSCNRNNIGNDLVAEIGSSSSGGNVNHEEDSHLLSWAYKPVSHLEIAPSQSYQMRSSESNYVTGLGPHASKQVMSLGREHHRPVHYFSPSSCSWQKSSSGLEAAPGRPRASTQVLGKIGTESNILSARPDYFALYPTAPLDIRRSYLEAGKVDFIQGVNLEHWDKRLDRVTAFLNCNGHPIEHPNELVVSIQGAPCEDEIASLSSQWCF